MSESYIPHFALSFISGNTIGVTNQTIQPLSL